MNKLRWYETFFLLVPGLNDDDRSALIERYQNIIKDYGGQIVKTDPWPLRKLAYRVASKTQGYFTHGYYVLLEYGGTGEGVAELQRNLRLDENVLKFMTIKKDDEFEPEKVEAAQPEPATSVETESVTTAETVEKEGE